MPCNAAHRKAARVYARNTDACAIVEGCPPEQTKGWLRRRATRRGKRWTALLGQDRPEPLRCAEGRRAGQNLRIFVIDKHESDAYKLDRTNNGTPGFAREVYDQIEGIGDDEEAEE